MRALIITIIALTFFSCGKDEVNYVPKPRMYPKVEFPTKSYKDFTEHYCNFTFEMPEYATIEQDTSFFDDAPADACWFDMEIEELRAELHFSYYPISPMKTFDVLIRDAFELASKHTSKATYIEEIPIRNQYGTTGLVFHLEGQVASPIQFYLTDSTHHFVRSSLYFNSKVNQESIAPILDFISADIDRMLSTFKWIDYE